jgi:hypothetical protein
MSIIYSPSKGYFNQISGWHADPNEATSFVNIPAGQVVPFADCDDAKAIDQPVQAHQ